MEFKEHQTPSSNLCGQHHLTRLHHHLTNLHHHLTADWVWWFWHLLVNCCFQSRVLDKVYLACWMRYWPYELVSLLCTTFLKNNLSGQISVPFVYHVTAVNKAKTKKSNCCNITSHVESCHACNTKQLSLFHKKVYCHKFFCSSHKMREID